MITPMDASLIQESIPVGLRSTLPSFIIQVYSTDSSADMVKQASVNATGLLNCHVQVADLQDLSAWGDNSVDAVTCCYGFMFPDDKVKAMSEARRVLKPVGTLIATYWREMVGQSRNRREAQYPRGGLLIF